jgi:hypothetical protein
MGYQCEPCNGAEPAVLLLTPLNGADTMAWGANCLTVQLIGLLAATVGIDPAALYEQVKKLHTQASEGEAGDGESAGERPRRRAAGTPKRADRNRPDGETGSVPAADTAAVAGPGERGTEGGDNR